MTLSPGDTGVYARHADRIDRAVQVGTASGRVVAVEFPATVPEDAESAGAILDRLLDYLDGEEDQFQDVSVALTVPTDQRAVLEATRNVPYGETVDPERIAQMATGIDPNDDDDQRTVRSALQSNPVPILVPDHRVRGIDGATPSDVASTLREMEGIRY
ncbi:MAG: methylated-DNA--[protein]-cysteine S-methyltransferase [Halobaculum sp.]